MNTLTTIAGRTSPLRWLCFLCFLCLATCALAAEPPRDDASPVGAAEGDAALITWLRDHRQDPLDFVVSRFAKNDVVIVGEHHEVRENCEFVRSLVPRLAAAGVLTLGSEFFCSSQQADVDRLVSGESDAFDEALGIAIQRELPWPTWGYREYLDIAREVWRVNHERKDGEPKMRLVGLDGDWSQIELWSKPRDMAVQMAARLGRENNMVTVTEREILEKNEKALLHVGFAHSILDQGARLGTQLRKKYGERIGQVGLHHKCDATETLERVIEQAGAGPSGFAVVGSPFATLRGFEMRVGPRSTVFALEDLAEAWVFLKPVKDLGKVGWIDGFIDDAHFKDARYVAIKRRWIAKKTDAATPEELNRKIAEALR